ncbi:putative E3 ubiquitin-protein ligase HERC3, partial [Stegodyphus mimosarum]
MPAKILFIHFGDDLFNKLKVLISDGCQRSLFQNRNCTVFNFLKESSYLRAIDEVFLSWSHVLIKVGEKVYHCGFNKSESSDNVHEVFCGIKNGSILKIVCGLQISFFVTNDRHCYVYSHTDFQPELIDFGSPDVKIKNVAVGDMHTVAVTESGEVFIINLQEKVTAILLPMPQPITEVACGKEHVLILSNSGQVFSYGFGSILQQRTARAWYN